MIKIIIANPNVLLFQMDGVIIPTLKYKMKRVVVFYLSVSFRTGGKGFQQLENEIAGNYKEKWHIHIPIAKKMPCPIATCF